MGMQSHADIEGLRFTMNVFLQQSYIDTSTYLVSEHSYRIGTEH